MTEPLRVQFIHDLESSPRSAKALALPAGVPVWIVHGLDDIIDIEDSRRLARAGAPAHVRYIEVDDDHALRASVQDGRLVTWVEALAALSAPRG